MVTYQREHYGADADSEREREHCDGKETRRLSQGTHRIPDVTPSLLEPHCSALITTALLDLLDCAEAALGAGVRVFHCHASGGVALLPQFDVQPHLLLHVAFQLPTP